MDSDFEVFPGEFRESSTFPLMLSIFCMLVICAGFPGVCVNANATNQWEWAALMYCCASQNFRAMRMAAALLEERRSVTEKNCTVLVKSLVFQPLPPSCSQNLPHRCRTQLRRTGGNQAWHWARGAQGRWKSQRVKVPCSALAKCSARRLGGSALALAWFVIDCDALRATQRRMITHDKPHRAVLKALQDSDRWRHTVAGTPKASLER